jgi:hypothetical protein
MSVWKDVRFRKSSTRLNREKAFPEFLNPKTQNPKAKP